MFAKLAVVLVLFSLCEGGVIRQNGTAAPQSGVAGGCKKMYEDCGGSDDCCKDSGPLICTAGKICLRPTDPLGPVPDPLGGANLIPANAGCGILSDKCNVTLDCCAPYICDRAGPELQCQEDSFMWPWLG